jgi:hypothetical protein
MVDANLSCEVLGSTCTSASQCCSGVCDPVVHQCAMGQCFGQGMPCSLNTDCCNLDCSGGTCGATACIQDGQTCGGNAQCCSGNCVGNRCAAANPTGCHTLGNACGTGDAGSGSNDCCSQNCENNVCVRAAGCQATGDVCYRNGDCCAGACNIATGAAAGVCVNPNTPGVGNCGVDGQPCNGAQDCCSALCVPTIYGGHACQTVSGCRVEGDLCRTASDCCSGQLANPYPQACVLDTTINPPIGRCRNPPGNICMGNPEGNVCGGAPGSDGSMTTRQDCCDCIPPKFNCCHPDLSGVYRCFGGSTPTCRNGYDGTPGCCIAVGGMCRFSAECCNGEPCVPDQNGVLRCGAMCIQAGGVCTSTGDCCAGLTCNIPPGSPTGTCGTITPPSDGGVPPDGGIIDAPTVDAAPVCSLAGQMCSVSQRCCAPLNCTDPSTGLSCTSTSRSCGCVIP